MGINVDTRVEKNVDAAEGVTEGTKKAMRDAADVGFGVSQNKVPHGADSTLANSGFAPEWRGENRVVWGYAATYAEYVEKGTSAHYPPIEPLKKWARRVLGDEGAAYAVQQKIGQEGTDAQPFIEPGAQRQARYLTGLGIDTYIARELE